MRCKSWGWASQNADRRLLHHLGLLPTGNSCFGGFFAGVLVVFDELHHGRVSDLAAAVAHLREANDPNALLCLDPPPVVLAVADECLVHLHHFAIPAQHEARVPDRLVDAEAHGVANHVQVLGDRVHLGSGDPNDGLRWNSED